MAAAQQVTSTYIMSSYNVPVVVPKPRGRSRARKPLSSRVSRVVQRAFEVQLNGDLGLIRTLREEEDDGQQEMVEEMAAAGAASAAEKVVEEEEPELSNLSLGQQAMNEAFEQAKRKRDPDETSEEEEPELSNLSLGQQAMNEAFEQAKRKRDPDETSSDSLTHAGVKVAKKMRGAFRSFADARTYARTLGLKSKDEWRAWSSSGKRPHDIPSRPDLLYKESGWTSCGDFLGYAVGKVTGSFRTFADARTYARTLGLKSRDEWRAWSSSGKRPHDIPSRPDLLYKESGWTSYGDFLGYAVGKVTGSFRTFADARTYVRTLGLKSENEWKEWRKSGARPHDIPSTPHRSYASLGWTSYNDFLGFAAGSFRSFEDARTYVRTLGLKSQKEWKEWSKSGARPHDIPSSPDKTYKSSGWTSYGDFLGYDKGKQAQSTQKSSNSRNEPPRREVFTT
ncbi:ribonuclease H1 N-terminal domain-containing protein [Pseudoscourfieldia marina]